MNAEQLKKILADHKKWLNHEPEGNQARLQDANLRGANLKGATYGNGIKMEKTPIQIIGFEYFVLILDNHIKIGCCLAPISEWIDNEYYLIPYDNEELWKSYKPALIAIPKASGRL